MKSVVHLYLADGSRVEVVKELEHLGGVLTPSGSGTTMAWLGLGKPKQLMLV